MATIYFLEKDHDLATCLVEFYGCMQEVGRAG